MDAIYDIAAGVGSGRVMLVMLPGARDRPEDLVEQGFVEAIRRRGLAVDVLVADAHVDYYLEHKVIERLAQDIVAPLRAKGYDRIWLMGISLGGMGSMAYVREHPADIEGVVLLAPFLGSRGLIAEVMRDGGLDRWRPEENNPDDDERMFLAWLKAYQADDPALPKIYLGYGTEDRFAPASLMLSARLPAGQVVSVKGGHDWPTWVHLWNQLLDRDLFSAGKTARQRASGLPKEHADE